MKTQQFLISSCLMAAVLDVSAADLTNGSFEDNLNGWAPIGNVSVKSSSPYTPSQGRKLVAFNSGNTTGAAGISQDLGGIEFGRSYQIDFDVGNFGYNPKPQKLEASVGGVWGTVTYNLALATIEVPGTTAGRTNWVSGSLTFVPFGVEAPISVAFQDKSGYSDGLDLVLDNVRISEVTPAPLIFDNGSFENGLAGWYTANTAGIRSQAPYRASDGSNLLAFDTGGTEIGTFISQSLGTVPGQRYLLYFDMGTLAANPNPRVLNIVVAGINPPLNEPYLIFNTESVSGDGHGTTTWISKNYEFTAFSTVTGLTFYEVTGQTGSADLLLDHIRIVPAPPKGQIVNGSFEYGFDGWELNTTGNIAALKSAPPYLPTDGNKVVAFNSGNTPNGSYLTQVVDTVPGKSYQIVLDVGNLSYVALPQSLRVSMWAGYPLHTEIITIPGTSTRGGINWVRNRRVPFTATDFKTRVLLADDSTCTDGLDLLIDNVRIESASP